MTQTEQPALFPLKPYTNAQEQIENLEAQLARSNALLQLTFRYLLSEGDRVSYPAHDIQEIMRGQNNDLLKAWVTEDTTTICLVRRGY